MTSPHHLQEVPAIAGDTGLDDIGAKATGNNATTTISTDLTAANTAASLEDGVGASLPALDDAMRATLTNGDAIADQEMPTMAHVKQEPVVEPSIPHIESENGDPYVLAGTHPMMNMNFSALNMGMGQAFNIPMGMDMGMSALPFDGHLESSPAPDSRITAYAALKFPDGMHYMNTTRLLLGRDNDLYKRMLKEERREDAQGTTNEANGVGPPRTPQPKGKASRYTQSVVSQSGGFFRKLGKGSDGQRRKKSKKSRRSESSDHGVSRRNSTAADFEYKAIAPDDEVPAPVTDAHRPNPDYEVTLLIHPMLEKGSAGFKKISRKHARIAYNYQLEAFELQALGNNGVFINGEHHACNTTMPLKGGDEIQIAEIEIQFLLPESAHADDGYETTDNGKQISFGFASSPRDAKLFADSGESDDQSRVESDDEDTRAAELDGAKKEEDDEEDSNVENGDEDDQMAYRELDDGQEQDDEDGEEEEESTTGMKIKPELTSPKPERRGPGRPPKDGIMSKKKARELQRQQEAQAANKDDGSPAEKGKNPVGRPRKHPRPEGEEQINKEKRKYTKRKPKDPNAVGAEGEDDGSKEKKEKKERRPRSPSPVFNEADLTPEQLAKPQQNYVQLIYDALKARPEGKMSLPQIYRAIARKYPYFVLKCGTVGWQSSVRHNLSQNDAFTKVERDGKGWMWAIVPGADVTKEKKKKATPPPQMPPNHHYYPLHPGPHPPHMMHNPMGPPPPGYMPGPLPPGARPPYPPGQYPPNGYAMPPQVYPPAPLPPPPPVQQNGYSSPYAQKPPSNPLQPTQPSNLGPDRKMSNGASAIPPIQNQPPQSRSVGLSSPSGPPPPTAGIDESVGRAVESFRGSLVKSLAGKSDQAELVVKSAIDRVLGISTVSLVPGDPHEEKIMGALRNVLAKMTGYPPATQYPPQHGAQAPTQSQPQQPRSSQPLSQPQQGTGVTPNTSQSYPAQQVQPAIGSTNGSTPSKPSSSLPTLSRPSLGPQRPPMGGMSRPPMMTPNMSRTNSGSPAPKAYSASPAAHTTQSVEATQREQAEDSPSQENIDRNKGSQASSVMLLPVTDAEMKDAIASNEVSSLTRAASINGILEQSKTAGNEGINNNGKRRLSDENTKAGDLSEPETKRQKDGVAS